MFKAKISDSKLFYSCFDAIFSIVDEVKLKIDSEGLRINALDKGHTNFVHLSLKNTFFDEFQCDESLSLDIDLSELIKVLKLIKSESIRLPSDEYNLIVVGEGETRSTFKIKLIDDLYDSPNPPLIEFPATVGIESKVFKGMVKKIAQFNDVGMNLIIDQDKMIVLGENEFNDTKVEYIHGDKVLGEYDSRIKINKVSDALKASDFSNDLYLSIGDGLPLKMIFKLISEEGELGFLIAPLVDKSEE